MKKIFTCLTLVLTLISCSKKSELSAIFNCKSTSLENTSMVTDFNKNFKLAIPITWKTNLYYDEFQSELFSADTTKQLTTSYILDASFNFGELIFDENYFYKSDSIIKVANLEKLNSGIIEFHSKPAYWYVVKGKKNNFNYHEFNLTIQLSENAYFNSYSEIYGTEAIEERICESIAIIETVEFLQ